MYILYKNNYYISLYNFFYDYVINAFLLLNLDITYAIELPASVSTYELPFKITDFK
ncbi:hypothetical protein [Clostridium sp.]|uniref:hypothetical protein n=1 Tax=Clostridium sp. TaxID=1506 RepID=UPI0034638E20